MCAAGHQVVPLPYMREATRMPDPMRHDAVPPIQELSLENHVVPGSKGAAVPLTENLMDNEDGHRMGVSENSGGTRAGVSAEILLQFPGSVQLGIGVQAYSQGSRGRNVVEHMHSIRAVRERDVGLVPEYVLHLVQRTRHRGWSSRHPQRSTRISKNRDPNPYLLPKAEPGEIQQWLQPTDAVDGAEHPLSHASTLNGESLVD